MLKILQARLQQYVNHELPDVQAGFGKGRGTRDQIGNIHWTIEKAREFQRKYLSISALLTVPKRLTESDGSTRTLDLPLKNSVCRSGSNS